MKKLFGVLLIFASSQVFAESTYPWYLPGKQKDVSAETYLVLNAGASESLVVCFVEGKKDSFVDVNSIDSAADNGNRTVTTRLYAGSCLVAHGTSVWVRNSGTDAAKGTFVK